MANERTQGGRQQLSRDEMRRRSRLIKMKKRRIKKLIALILGIIIIIAVAVTLSLTVFFRIDNVAVTGDEIYNNEDVIAASQINIGDNMFMTSKKKTASGITSGGCSDGRTSSSSYRITCGPSPCGQEPSSSVR